MVKISCKMCRVLPAASAALLQHGSANPRQLRGVERVLLTPDCGFATFADSPVTSARAAEAKLRAIVEAAGILRKGLAFVKTLPREYRSRP